MSIAAAATAGLLAWERELASLAHEAEATQPVVPRTHISLSDSLLLARAYAYCDEVISEHGKTFRLASALLPRAKRRAIRALYAFCRTTDDIVDCSDDIPESKEAKLEAWRCRALSAFPPWHDLVALAWTDTRLRYGVPSRYAETRTGFPT